MHGGHGKYDVYVCDVTDVVEIHNTIDAIVKKYGAIDTLINNAGVSGPVGSIADTNPYEWAKCINVNILGTYYCTHAVLPHFFCNGSGRIVNLASSHCIVKRPNVSSYSTSKIAVVRFTELLHLEYSSGNIFSFAIHPGTISTDMTRNIAELVKEGHALVPGLKDMIDKRGTDTPFSAMQLIIEIVKGRHDKLSGKFLQAKYNIDLIEKNIEMINKTNLLNISINEIIKEI